MVSIGDGRGDHVVYDWDTDQLRTFRSYPRAFDHAVKLQNHGHDIYVWTERTYGDDTAKWPGLT
jgi:hypothetical protein